MSMIFNVIIAITMFLCFFSLSSSMSANIFEQSTEIGVMRAIGLTKLALTRIYYFEALILVLGGSLLGTLVGSAVAYTMVL